MAKSLSSIYGTTADHAKVLPDSKPSEKMGSEIGSRSADP